MANTYNSVPVLSKIKLGNSIYYVKDADVRALLDTYGNVVTKNIAEAISDSDTGLASGKQVYNYVTNAIGNIGEAMHFKGGVAAKPAVDSYVAGDVIVVTAGEDQGKEFVLVVSGDPAVKSWVELGNEHGHVLKTLTIAGIDLQDDITVSELQGALKLKAFAYVDTASVTVTDYATDITGAEYTPAGSITVELKQTPTEMTATGTHTATGSVTVAAASDEDTNKFQISGSNAASTVTIDPKTTSVIKVKTAGSEPSYTAGSYTAPSVSETTSKFNTDGIKAHIATQAEIDADNTLDGETLIFEAAAKSDALTGTGFNAGSYTAPIYTAGKLPEFEDVTVWNGYNSAEAAAQTFTGGKIKATFAGNADSVSVTGNYDKATVDTDPTKTKFTGTAATITPTLDKGNKTITVSASANNG